MAAQTQSANLCSTSSNAVDAYNNPYYLHHNDHAGLIIVSDRLTNGADFHSWRRSVRMALNVRNKLGFIDGTIPKPAENHRDFGSWSRCNDIVATWLINSVDKKIGQSLLFINTAEGIWKNMCSRFKQDDAPRIYEIEQKLSSIQQGHLDVSSYYTSLVTLWEEYRNYVELPVCTCGKCECSAAELWEKLQQRSRVTKFLMGLNDSYEASRRHILMLKPIPTIEEAFNMVTSDERQKHIKPSGTSPNVVFHTSDNYSADPNASTTSAYNGSLENAACTIQNQYRSRPSRPICTHCGQTGHVIQKCFKLHGYPPGYIPGYKNNGYQQTSRPFSPSNQPRGQFPQTPKPAAHAVANIMANSSTTAMVNPSAPYIPPPAINAMNLDVSQMNSDQIQSLISQLSNHVTNQVAVSTNTATPATSQLSSITAHGVMAPQSSSGVYSGIDDW